MQREKNIMHYLLMSEYRLHGNNLASNDLETSFDESILEARENPQDQ